MPSLLALDLGLRGGLAIYGSDGRLLCYRSHSFGTVSRLKKAVWGVLSEVEELAYVVVEGDLRLAHIWGRAAKKRGAELLVVTPEAWRARLLFARERQTGPLAKSHAGRVARAVIAWSGRKAPTSLRHDAAEAIAIGLFGVLEVGWLPSIPRELCAAR